MITPEDLLVLIGGADYNATQVEDLERGAVAFIQTQIGRYFGPPELVEEFAIGNGGRRLYLRDHVTNGPDEYEDEPPMLVVVERSVPGGTASVLVQGVDFDLRQQEKESYLVRLDGGVWTKDNEYAVTYWRGYQAGEEPEDIRALVIALVRFGWESIVEGTLGMKSETIGGYSYERFGKDDLESVSGWDTIEAWHRPVVA